MKAQGKNSKGRKAIVMVLALCMSYNADHIDILNGFQVTQGAPFSDMTKVLRVIAKKYKCKRYGF